MLHVDCVAILVLLLPNLPAAADAQVATAREYGGGGEMPLVDPSPEMMLAPVVKPSGEPEELPLPAGEVSPATDVHDDLLLLTVPAGEPADAPPAELDTPASEELAAGMTSRHRLRDLHGFWGYRVSEQSIGWTLGDGDQFGGLWLLPDPYVKAGATSGVTFGLGIGFLAGPERTDMPPRVFDFSVGYQKRAQVGDLSYDLAGSVLAASDFEGSSRDGIRFPAHAVGYLTLTPQIDLAFGVDFLDRADVRLLPVGGLLLRPDPRWRIELVFPRPRVELQIAPENRLYFYGGLGGGSWAVERDSELDDLASLYELQAAVGLMSGSTTIGASNAMEMVFLFDRKLEYESGFGDYLIGPTLMLRTVTQY